MNEAVSEIPWQWAILVLLALLILTTTACLSAVSRQRRRLHRVEGKLNAVLQRLEMTPGVSLYPEVRALARQPGQKIAAIKRHRDLNPGLGLIEAKAQVEEYLEGDR